MCNKEITQVKLCDLHPHEPYLPLLPTSAEQSDHSALWLLIFASKILLLTYCFRAYYCLRNCYAILLARALPVHVCECLSQLLHCVTVLQWFLLSSTYSAFLSVFVLTGTSNSTHFPSLSCDISRPLVTSFVTLLGEWYTYCKYAVYICAQISMWLWLWDISQSINQ